MLITCDKPNSITSNLLKHFDWSIYTAQLLCLMFIEPLMSKLYSKSRFHIPEFSILKFS